MNNPFKSIVAMDTIDDLYLISTCWEKLLPTCKEILLVNTSGQSRFELSQQRIINKKVEQKLAASPTVHPA